MQSKIREIQQAEDSANWETPKSARLWAVFFEHKFNFIDPEA